MFTDKGKKKNTSGTPEKPGSPEGFAEPVKSQIINNEEIQNLAIKYEDLANVRLQCKVFLMRFLRSNSWDSKGFPNLLDVSTHMKE